MLLVEISLQAAEGMPTSLGAGRPRLTARVLSQLQAGLHRTASASPCAYAALLVLSCWPAARAEESQVCLCAAEECNMQFIMLRSKTACHVLFWTRTCGPPFYCFSNVVIVTSVLWNSIIVPACSPAVDKKSSVFSAGYWRQVLPPLSYSVLFRLWGCSHKHESTTPA